MPNFPGAIAYPLLAGRTVMVDDGSITKNREVTIPRGGTTPDYNVKLRGSGRRIDVYPRKPEV